MQIVLPNVPLQEIKNSLTKANQVRLFVLRLDLNHPHISGNKPYKLKYNLLEATKQNKNALLTFGGAYSNHIVATAFAGKEYGFKTIGIIRGEETKPQNKSLQSAVDCGMQLHYVTREEYRNKENFQFGNLTMSQFGNCYVIPEGGANELGIEGCKEILSNIKISFDVVCCACGTGTTLAGIILSLTESQHALGFQVLKGKDYLKNEIQKWLNKLTVETHKREEKEIVTSWNINEDYHFGGYAKTNNDLTTFIKQFETEHNIPLDNIYTGKMFYGIIDLIKKGHFEKGKSIVAIHTGVLQGMVNLS
jgi:1-aminocyclopropane-1-carboxylate deaminase